MNAMESKKDAELINIVMNSEVDFDCRIHAAKEVLSRLGVKPWEKQDTSQKSTPNVGLN